jgi:mono/diheme cytochrome c family protein
MKGSVLKRTRPFQPSARAAVALALFLVAGRAWADDDDDLGGARTPLLPAYKTECSACHIAYPPDMLAASAWRRVIDNLPHHHYGTDASLDPATARTLSGWLAANSSSRLAPGAAPTGDRITQSSWFVRQHREVSAATWKRPSIRSAANCSACHAQADQGAFDEHDVRIPR